MYYLFYLISIINLKLIEIVVLFNQEFILEEDFNRMESVGDILAHYGRITGMIWTEVSIDNNMEQWILSTSRDKRFQYHNAKNGNPIGTPFVCGSWCTSLEYPFIKL